MGKWIISKKGLCPDSVWMFPVQEAHVLTHPDSNVFKFQYLLLLEELLLQTSSTARGPQKNDGKQL